MKVNRSLRILLTLVFFAWVDVALAQEYIYFDLSAGNITINYTSSNKKYTGYRWKTVNGTTTRETVTGTHTTTNKYYVYQSQDAYPSATTSYKTTTGNQNGTIVVPTYEDVYCEGQAWADYVTNNTDVDAVNSNWIALAPTTYRQEVTDYCIKITGNSTYDLTIDNLWSTYGSAYAGSIYLVEGYQNVKTTIRLKNTNKLMRVFYTRKINQQGYLKFTSDDGDGSNNGSLTLTYPDDGRRLHCYSLIGPGKDHGGDPGNYGFPYGQCAGVYFDGGTIYAGGRKNDNSIWPDAYSYYSVIGGVNSYGEMYFSGGRVTAISNSTAAAIGGGGGYNGQYGSCKIDITGGEVYAYNFGVYLQEYDMVVPGTAIGGGSTGGGGTTYNWNYCGNAEIAISGGTVYAKSVGGAAIGGGTSAVRYGGYANITISENANVVAESVAGIIADTYEVEAGAGLGGGTVGHSAPASGKGGDADITITGGIINATAIGGGNSLSKKGNAGAANVTVTGGTAIVQGKIGGGEASGSGAGGDASIYVTDGTLDCASVGGGNSKTGSPGAVSHATRAGVQIEGGTVLSGYIGGGTNNNGAIGKATAYITGGDIQGQFIMSNTTSTTTNHCYFNMDGGTIDNANVGVGKYQPAKDEGGVLYMDDNNGTVNITGGTIQDGTGTLGGAVYMTAGSFEIGGTGIIQNNTATTNGGAVYLGGTGSFTMKGGTISGNTADVSGGGVYVNSGMVTVSGDANIANNSGTQFGGGLYMGGGTANFTGGNISGNSVTAGHGGGIFMDGGICTLSGGSVIGGEGSAYGNTAKYGGGIYSAGGTITVEGGKIQYNNASEAGGGIYTNGPEGIVNVKEDDTNGTFALIEYNSSKNGGGIYANRGTVNFSNGYIKYNYASEAGGGLYVNDNGGDDYGQLFLKGSAQLIRNHVPTGKAGGGVYLKGVITIGEQTDDPSDLGVITAKENFAYTTSTPETYVITNDTRNNVFLPAPAVDRTYHKDVITVIEDGISDFSEIGFSVPTNFVPVIYCANSGIPCIIPGYEDYTTSQYFLHQFSTGMEFDDNLFDDTHRYTAVHYADQPTVFDPDHVYLYGFWTNVVNEDPTGGHFEPGDIDTPEKLAYFISYVNGINGCDPHPNADGNITADIDMSQYGWVPIGEPNLGYSGTLNGNGHTITGISSLLNSDHIAYGIIGNLDGGTVKNLFIKDAVYALEYKDDLVIGGLVGEASGNVTIENTEVSCSMSTAHPNTVMGGLVGRTGKVDMATSSEYIVSGNSIPVNGAAADKYQKTEFVIPASQLTSMVGDYFSSMQFYLSSRVEDDWGESSFLIFMKEVEGTELSGFTGTDGATVVYEGALSMSGTRLGINFDGAYHYGGGNLLVGIYETTPGTASPASFYGCSLPNAAVHGESGTSLDDITSGTLTNFMPKVLLKTSMQEVVTGEGTNTSGRIPIYGNHVKGYYQKTEYIIPASELTALAGGRLTQMKLFLKNTGTSWGSAQRFKVYLKEVTNTTVGTTFTAVSGATQVFAGKLNCTSNTMTISFSTPFEYHGGNLLVIVHETTKGTTNTPIPFYGVTTTEYVSIYGENSTKLSNITTGERYMYRPKTQFKAEEATSHQVVCDGAKTSHVIPVGGQSAHMYQKNEFVIPASDIAATNGSELTSLKFFLSVPATDTWGDATFKVFLKETASTTMTDFSGIEGAAIVYEGSLEATGTTMQINFMNTYTYGGGNLLVGIYQTGTGTATDAVFAGIEVDNASIHGENASSLDAITAGDLQNMRPKTVVGYLPAAEIMGTQTIHSSIAITDMSGYLMGGLVGQNLKGNFSNCFTNTKFNYKGTTQYYAGLVAVNRGTVENCYVRFREIGTPSGNFGVFAGDNINGTLNYCYAPEGMENYIKVGEDPNGSGNYGVTHVPYLYKHHDTQVSATNDYVSTDADADNQMTEVLNRWVDAQSTTGVTYTRWGRPWQESDTLKPINHDYPVLKMPFVEAVASKKDNPYLYYSTVDTLLSKYTEAGSAIWMYGNSESVKGDNSASYAKLYIAEDVALLNDNPLKAYVGITLDNSAGTNGAHPTYGSFVGITTDATDWHMISTPLLDAPLGIEYTDNTAWGFDLNYGHPSGMPYYRFYPESDTLHGYFPSHRYNKDYPTSNTSIEDGSYYQEWDFYSYDEPQYHWINFKRNSASHYHFDTENHDPLTYKNEKYLVPGKGYFAATREETFLQCQGHLNADEVTIGLTHTPNIPRHGYNLIGNPYQAYLNFDAFADANWGDDVENIWGEGETPSYTILDEDVLDLTDSVETVMGRKPVFYKTFSYRCSDNPGVSAGRFIHPHQGFFVRLGEDRTGATASFSPDQRNATDTVTSKFRGNDHIDYPLVNLFAIEENGAADVVTVELGRPDQGGAALMQSLRVGNGKIWCHYNDKDYAIAYTQPGISEVAIRFESVKDTEYTMRWSTRNGDFSYLHLIDNVTGADVDCLATDEYKFSASTSDYKSRFRLVFGYTGIEEPEEVETSQNFAFVMGDELVVTGEGVLQVFDMTGRMVTSQELHGVQTTVSLPNAANGVYVMRLTEGKQSRIQKMVISK